MVEDKYREYLTSIIQHCVIVYNVYYCHLRLSFARRAKLKYKVIINTTQCHVKFVNISHI